jgi:RNA polymerase sigma factor (sigma-70 family)
MDAELAIAEIRVNKNLKVEFEKHHKGILNFIKARIGSREDAEDILQEVFESAVLYPNILAPMENFTGWLYTVAKNKVIDWYRKKRLNTVSMNFRPPAKPDAAQKTLDDIIHDADIDIEKDFVKDIVMDELIRAIETLPEEQRFVIVRQAIEGTTFKELSQKTGVPLNTLLARKRYAVKTLGKRLAHIRELIDESE